MDSKRDRDRRLQERLGRGHALRRRAAGVRVTVATTLDGLALDGVTGIDMPLGLLADGWRDADLLARRALGRRGSCVFAIPPRPVWERPSYAEANRCRELTGRGMSAQAWGLRGKLMEADEFRRGGAPLYEVHPELSFAALAAARRWRTPSTPRRGGPGAARCWRRPGSPCRPASPARPRMTCSTRRRWRGAPAGSRPALPSRSATRTSAPTTAGRSRSATECRGKSHEIEVG